VLIVSTFGIPSFFLSHRRDVPHLFKARLGSETESVLQILNELIQVVAVIANTAKDHAHDTPTMTHR
jgi:hypothetical protein